jgi:hypothetical protein
LLNNRSIIKPYEGGEDMSNVRNRMSGQNNYGTQHTIVDIEALMALNQCPPPSLSPDMYFEILKQIQNTQTLIAFSQSSWSLFSTVLLNAHQVRLMEMYQKQIDRLHEPARFLVSMRVHHEQFKQFSKLARTDVPSLIRDTQQKGNVAVSVFKLAGFIDSVRLTIDSIDHYYKIESAQHCASAQQNTANIILKKMLAIAALGLALSYLLDSNAILILTSIGAVITFARDLWNALENQDNHWDKNTQLQTRISRQFTDFVASNKGYGPLAQRVLLTFSNSGNHEDTERVLPLVQQDRARP